MVTVKDSIEVNVPASLAYTYWSRFEDFPKFMGGVEEIRRTSADQMHWRAKVAGKKEEWDAKVTEDVPSRRIAWRSTSGLKNGGSVAFEILSPTSTRIDLAMDYEPEGLMEKAGAFLGMDKRQVHRDLENFKKYAEGQTTIGT
jgi:uncharacterized membrane protein